MLPGNVVYDCVDEYWYDKHSGLDVVPLYEEWVSDGQEALDRDGDRSVARTSQRNLRSNSSHWLL